MGIMSDLIERADNPEDILEGFHEKRITHLLVGYNLLDRWLKDNFTEVKQKLARDFFRMHTNLLFLENEFGVNMLIVDNKNDNENY